MVTIIIANENTRQALNLCLLSIRKYTKKPYRVIVADNSSTDGSLKLLKSFSRVKTLKVSGLRLGERHGKALDLAAKKVRAKYLLALDSDVEILDHNWLDSMVDKVSETDAAFAGEISPAQKTTYWGNFKERTLPYCLLVNTAFFKKKQLHLRAEVQLETKRLSRRCWNRHFIQSKKNKSSLQHHRPGY